MPLPIPSPGEAQDQFLERCIPILMDEGYQEDEAVAICSTQYTETMPTKKGNNVYSIKGAFELKDLDLAAREVAMYVSKFDVIDSDNDLIRRGAFKKSIEERGPSSSGNRKIAFLRHHNWEMQIGKAIHMEEDQNGLFVVSRLGNSTQGNDALEDYKDGIIREHSIGFKYIEDKIRFVEGDTKEGGYFEIAEVALWEYSAVTFGANQYTDVVAVAKGQDKADVAKKLLDDINQVTKALINGQGTDERLYSLEMKLKFLNARLYELALTEPTQKGYSADRDQQETFFDWNRVVNNLKV
jgi:HK97 family phage prohead protease